MEPLADAAVDIAHPGGRDHARCRARRPQRREGGGRRSAAAAIARALYFTRATVPANEGPHYHHIGLYAYRRAALERFVALPPGILEQREKLEQLRALEAGMRIDVALVDTVPLGVDTPAELERARAILAPVGAVISPNRRRITWRAKSDNIIAFQGLPGAYSDLACRAAFPEMTTLPCPSFEDAFAAVQERRCASSA